MKETNRRDFMKVAGSATIALALPGVASAAPRQVSVESIVNNVLPSEDTYITGYIDFPDKSSWKYYISSNNYMHSRITRGHNIHQRSDYLNFVTTDKHPIPELAKQFRKHYRTNEAVSQGILDFLHHQIIWEDVQERKYNHDLVKYPIETLVEKCGDCEDISILGASLIKSAGIDVALLWFPNLKHTALGIKGDFGDGFRYTFNGDNYYYAEPSSKERNVKSPFIIGEIPKEFGRPKAVVYKVK